MLILLSSFYFFIVVVVSKPASQKTHTSKSHVRKTKPVTNILEDEYKNIVKDYELQHITPNTSMNLWELSEELEGDIRLSDGIAARNIQRIHLWPKGIIPCTIVKNQFDSQEVATIRANMNILEDILSPRGITDGTCQIKFVRRTENDHNYLEIMRAGPRMCWSSIGVVGGKQKLSLGKGCVEKAYIIHELCHALGLAHQQSAHNRDNYVEIIWNNIKPNKSGNFVKKNFTDYTSFGLNYDFKSIMHYSSFAFAKVKDGKIVGPTIVSRDPYIKIKQNKELSELDKLKLELMYCKHHTSIRIGTKQIDLHGKDS